MEKIKELIEMKFLFREFHTTLKEMVVLLTTEEKEATKLEYALRKYTGHKLYSEDSSKAVDLYIPLKIIINNEKVNTYFPDIYESKEEALEAIKFN